MVQSRAPRTRSTEGSWPFGRGPRARVGVMIKRSAWSSYLEERPDPKLQRLVDEQDATVEPIRAAHEEHESTVREVKEALAGVGAEIAFVHRTGEPFDATGLDLVVT